MQRKYAFIFHGDYWDNMWRRRQQIAWGLARRPCVKLAVYVEQPLTLVSFLKFVVGRADPEASSRWRRILVRGFVFRAATNIWIVTPVAIMGVSHWRRFGYWQLRLRGLFGGWLTRFVLFSSRHGEKVILWISLPWLVIPSGVLSAAHLVWYDCTEDFSLLWGHDSSWRKLISCLDEWWTRRADVVSVVSQKLFDRKTLDNLFTYRVMNGVDLAAFKDISVQEPVDIARLPHPRLCSVGMVNDRYDWDLVRQIADMRPHWSIVFIGPVSLPTALRKKLPKQVHYLGSKRYSELPCYLAYSDVAVQVYKVDSLNDSGNSQKVFLYLASGIPIVSTPSADVRVFADEVAIATSASDFVQQVERAVAEHSPSASVARQRLAQQHSWDKRIDHIVSILEDRDPR